MSLTTKIDEMLRITDQPVSNFDEYQVLNRLQNKPHILKGFNCKNLRYFFRNDAIINNALIVALLRANVN